MSGYAATRVFSKACRWLVAGVALLCLLGTNITWADSEVSPAANAITASSRLELPFAFRRVFVPENRLEDWPTTGTRLLPMDLEAFEELVKSLEKRREANLADHAQFESASHSASWGPEAGFTGSSLLAIKLHGDIPQLLPLDLTGVVLISAHWQDNPDVPASLALWNQQPQGKPTYGLLADRSGTVELHWKLSPQRPQRTEFAYRFKLSSAAQQELHLSVPLGYLPNLSAATQFKAAAMEGQEQWGFQLAPGEVQDITITQEQPEEAVRTEESIRVIQHEEYDLKNLGLHYLTTLTLSEASSSSSIVLKRTEPLDLFEVTVDDTPASWRWQNEKRERLVVDLPQRASQHIVKLQCGSKLVKDRAWQLPRLRPEAPVWSQGTSLLRVSPRISLKSLRPSDCQIVNTTGIGTKSSAAETIEETYELQDHSEQARVEVLIASRSQQTTQQQTTLVKLDDTSSTSRVVLTLHSQHANVFQLEADISNEWIIDSIQADRASDLAHWHVDQAENQAVLRLQLQRSPSPNQPVRLVIDARSSLTEEHLPLAIKKLDWLQLTEKKVTRHWLGVQTLASRETKLTVGPRESLLETKEYEANDFGFNQLDEQLLVIDLKQLNRDTQVRAATEAPEFDARALVQAKVDSAGVDYSVELTCEPTRGGVQELMVASSTPLPKDATWELPATQEFLLVEETKDNSQGTTSSYRVMLPSPQFEDFTLRVKYRRAAELETSQAEHSIDGFFVPEATQFQAWALPFLDPDVQNSGVYSVEQRGGTPVTPPEDPQLDGQTGQDGALLGCFRFDIDRPLSVSRTPAILHEPSRKPDIVASKHQEVYCQQAIITTTHSGAGLVSGSVSYHLSLLEDSLSNSTTSEPFAFEFAENTILMSAEFNDKTVAVSKVPGTLPTGINRYLVNAPANTNGILRLRYEAQSDNLTHGTVVSAHSPTPSFTVARGRWNLWTPEEYVVGGLLQSQPAEKLNSAGLNSVGSPSRELTILQRLFGPLTERGRSASFYSITNFASLEKRQPSPKGALSAAVGADDDESLGLGGWRLSVREFTELPLPVKVSQQIRQRSLWLALWLVTTVVSFVSLARYSRFVLATLGSIALLCLLLPENTISLPQACFLGCVTGCVLNIVLRGALSTNATWLLNASPSEAHVIAGAMLLAGCFVTLPAENSSAAEVLPAVLIPIDQTTEQPTGEVYLPSDLMRRMQLGNKLKTTGGATWALMAAKYLIALEQSSTGQPAKGRESTLAFRVQTFAPNLSIHLPLDFQEAAWLEDKHTLNGRPIKVAWEKDSQGCALEIPAAGVYEIRLRFVPRPKNRIRSRRLFIVSPPPYWFAIGTDYPKRIR